MPTTGPWMDDATPVEQMVLNRTTRSGVDTWGWQTAGSAGVSQPGLALESAWTASAPVTGPEAGFLSSWLDVSYGDTTTTAQWAMTWLTCPKPSAPTVTASTPPAGWDSDPNVIGVEWEPTTTVQGQRVQVVVYEIVNDSFDQRPFHVKMVDGVGSTYQPAYEPASSAAARSTVASTGPTALAGIEEQGVAEILSPPITVDPGGSGFAVAVLDDLTENQDETGADHLGVVTGVAFYSTRVKLYYTLRPRYRLVYSDAPAAVVTATRVTPSLRMLQRGGAGGMGGIPRMVGNPTRRGSLRQGPGSVY